MNFFLKKKDTQNFPSQGGVHPTPPKIITNRGGRRVPPGRPTWGGETQRGVENPPKNPMRGGEGGIPPKALFVPGGGTPHRTHPVPEIGGRGGPQGPQNLQVTSARNMSPD